MNKEIQERINAVREKNIPDGYIETEAGVLPQDWKVATLGDVADEIVERAGTHAYETLSISAGVGFVNQAQKFGKELSGKQYEKYTVLHNGDFSYNKGNSNKCPQGCIYRLNDREVAAVPNVFESFRIKSGCAKYYEQLFSSGFLNKQLTRKINHGVRDDGLLNLTGKDFYSCFLPVPQLKEQKKIAEVLSICDRVIKLKKELITKKYKQKIWLMKVLLDPDSDMRLSGFEKIQWKQISLGDECHMFSGGTPKAGKDEYYADGTIPFIRSGEISDTSTELFLTELGYESCSAKMVEVGDILYALYGANSGDCSISKMNGAINQAILCILPKTLNRELLYHVLCMLKKKIVSTYLQGGQGNLSAEIIKKLIVTVPADSKYQQVVVEKLAIADKEISLLEQELEVWKQKKKALMELLLTGIVRCNYDK